MEKEEIKISPPVKMPVETPAEPDARDCDRGPATRTGEPLGPARTGSSPSATTRESGTQTEPGPTLGLAEETLDQPRGGHGAGRGTKREKPEGPMGLPPSGSSEKREKYHGGYCPCYAERWRQAPQSPKRGGR